MFFSCAATLRSRYYPEELQSSIMSVFRLPLNLIVVIGTRLADKANNIPSMQNVFGIIAVINVIAFIMQCSLLLHTSSNKSNDNKNKRKID